MKRLLIIVLCASLSSCSSDSNKNEEKSADYDKEAMLTNWADNIIIPSFTDYQSKIDNLNEKTNAFIEAPTTETLSEIRASWLTAYKTYQHVGIFDTGVATSLHLIDTANTYPTSTENIESNVISGSYDLSTQAQYASQGFPALDYLLYGLADTDDDILSYYTTNTNATGYKTYLTDVVSNLKNIIDEIVTDWNNGYRETYISNSNAVTGSLNQTANNFMENFEKDVRAPKVGIPAGLFSNGVLYSEKVEAYYKNDISRTLLIESINASSNFFNGYTYGTTTTGLGLKEYLDAVNATSDGESLSSIINNQYDDIIVSANLLNESFSDQVTEDNSKMIDTYNAIQQNVVYLKLDMFSALSLFIDYVDGDGD